MKSQKQGTMEKSERNDASILLRLPEELKIALQKQAYANGRRITAEINTRLRESLEPKHGPTLTTILTREQVAKALPASYTAVHTPVLNHTNDNGPAPVLSDLDRAMLTVFHQLPVEKQLALLSLFRQ